MFRERTYVVPVCLDDLDHESPECRRFALSALQRSGVVRLSFVRRGGSSECFVPDPDEACYIHESYGKFGLPAETRFGRNVEQVTEARVFYEEPQYV